MPSIRRSANIIIIVLITIKNSPKVTTVIGKESTINIGLRNILSRLTTKENHKASVKSLTLICGNTLLSPKMSKLVIIRFRIYFILVYFCRNWEAISKNSLGFSTCTQWPAPSTITSVALGKCCLMSAISSGST